MTLPNFLIVGAAKCGTTSLYYYLKQHPDICMAKIKEPKYFVNWQGDVNNLAEYENLFSECTGKKARGEASVFYLYAEESPQMIKDALQEAKIIIILRNPAEMAFSLWRHVSRLGKRGEWLSFKKALDEEPRRMSDPGFRAGCTKCWHGNFYYFDRGLYYPQVKRYIDTFGRENVNVYIFEEFMGDPVGTCKDIFRFLGVNDKFVPKIERHNVGAEVRHRGLQKLINKPPERIKVLAGFIPGRVRTSIKEALLRINEKKAPKLEPSIKEELLTRYRPDMEKLERLLGRKLSIWYQR